MIFQKGFSKRSCFKAKAKVVSPDGDTEYFEILAGVMQGDTLAPYLFVIVLDYAMRQATEGKEEELGLTIKQRQSQRVPDNGSRLC